MTDDTRDFGYITDGEILTWEIELARKGTLTPAVQATLLKYVASRRRGGPPYTRQHVGWGGT